MEYMDKEQFKRKYLDTHKGIHCVGDLTNGSFDKGSLIKQSNGDKNIRTHGKIPGKNVIEKKCIEDRAEDKKHYIMDAVSVRADEILDKESMPFDKLLNSMIKILPQKVEANVMNFTFADMARMATQDFENKGKTVDVDAKVEKEND